MCEQLVFDIVEVYYGTAALALGLGEDGSEAADFEGNQTGVLVGWWTHLQGYGLVGGKEVVGGFSLGFGCGVWIGRLIER